MRAWKGVGLAAGLVVLIGAVVAAVVLSVASDEDTESSSDNPFGVRGEGVIRTTPQPLDDELAESDADPSLPGRYTGSQGRGHFEGGFAGHEMTPFCEYVAGSDTADIVTQVPIPETTPPISIETNPVECYWSNPPSSGRHLGVQRNVDIGGGSLINIPPDPDVYPHDVEIPRDAIPHILEHAGVFVGYHCAEGDAACEEFVAEIEDLVNQRIDEHDDRVVMARDTDLPVGEIGLAAWTRVLNVRWDEAELDDIEEFISVHSCRFDPEGFC